MILFSCYVLKCPLFDLLFSSPVHHFDLTTLPLSVRYYAPRPTVGTLNSATIRSSVCLFHAPRCISGCCYYRTPVEEEEEEFIFQPTT